MSEYDAKDLIQTAQVFDTAAEVYRESGNREKAISRRKLAFGARKFARREI